MTAVSRKSDDVDYGSDAGSYLSPTRLRSSGVAGICSGETWLKLRRHDPVPEISIPLHDLQSVTNTEITDVHVILGKCSGHHV
jgi:hypothetical protein